MKMCRNPVVAWSLALFFSLAFLGRSWAGNLEPSDDPGPTMYTLEQIYNNTTTQGEKLYNKPIWKIWGKTFADWPDNKRFAVSVDGIIMGGGPIWGDMVLDKETGLVWTRDSRSGAGRMTWFEAEEYGYDLEWGGRMGWRVPRVQELASLMEYTPSNSPRLPTGHPFQNVDDVDCSYWSSTTCAGDTTRAWIVHMRGDVYYGVRTSTYYVWAVRGAQ